MRMSDSNSTCVQCPFFVSIDAANITCRSTPRLRLKVTFEKTDDSSSTEKVAEHLRHYCYAIQDVSDPGCCPLFATLWRLWEAKQND